MKVIFTKEEISEKVTATGHLIADYFDSEILMIILANGAIPFAADLMRAMENIPVLVDVLCVSEYANNKTTDALKFRSTLKISPAGKKILLIDDVLDSGKMLKKVKKYLLNLGAAEIKTAVAVEKKVQRSSDALQHADWACFVTDGKYLAGYGMDSDEYCRNLPYIAEVE